MQEPTDLTSGLLQLFTDFRSGWFLGATTLCYICIQLLRGKAGFEVPFITPKLEALNKEAKTYIIVVFFALAGFFTAFSAPKINFSVLFNGFIGGLMVGIGTIGTRSVVKQGIEGTKNYLDKKKQSTSENNSDQPGSDQ